MPRREQMHVMAKLDVRSCTTELERRESGPRPLVCPWVAIDKGDGLRGESVGVLMSSEVKAEVRAEVLGHLQGAPSPRDCEKGVHQVS